MSKIKEFIVNWNSYLADSKISENEFKNVTETSFRYWLIAVLNKLRVDTTCYENMHHENGIKLRTSRLRLLSTINHFLCISNIPKLNYKNLINPDYKTVTKTLMYLLNYVFYVKHFFEETIAKCAEEVLVRDQLQTKKNQLRKDIEVSKIQEENSAKTLRDLEKTIPQQKSTIASLQEKEERLKQEARRIEEENEKSEMKLADYKAQIASINENIVSEEEGDCILASKVRIQAQLQEQEDIIVANRHKLKENSTAIEAAHSLTIKMEAILSQFSLDASDMKNMKSNLDNLKSHSAKMKGNVARFDSEIESLTQRIQLKKGNIDKLAEQKEELENTIGNEDKSNVQTLKQLTRELRNLCVKENDLNEKREKAKGELELLYKVASNILKQMSENIYEDYLI